MATRRVTLGRVAGVYGIRGWVRVYSQTRPAGRILDYRRWWIRQGDREYPAQLVDGHEHGRGVVAQFSDEQGHPIEDRDIAAGWIGAEIQVDRDQMPRLPNGRYYWIELIGLKVVNPSGVVLGTVRDMTDNGAHDVLVVVDEAGTERLIPFVRRHIVKRVEMGAGRIVCDWEPDY